MTNSSNIFKKARKWALFFYTLYVCLIPLNIFGIPDFIMKFPLPTISLLSLTPSIFHLGKPGLMHHTDISESIIGLIVFLILLQVLIAWLHFKNSESLLKNEKPRLFPYFLSYAHYLIILIATLSEPNFSDETKSILFFGTLIALVLVSLGLMVTKKVADYNQTIENKTGKNE